MKARAHWFEPEAEAATAAAASGREVSGAADRAGEAAWRTRPSNNSPPNSRCRRGRCWSSSPPPASTRKKEGDKLTEQDKTRLLDYLRKQHGAAARAQEAHHADAQADDRDQGRRLERQGAHDPGRGAQEARARAPRRRGRAAARPPPSSRPSRSRPSSRRAEPSRRRRRPNPRRRPRRSRRAGAAGRAGRTCTCRRRKSPRARKSRARRRSC